MAAKGLLGAAETGVTPWAGEDGWCPRSAGTLAFRAVAGGRATGFPASSAQTRAGVGDPAAGGAGSCSPPPVLT